MYVLYALQKLHVLFANIIFIQINIKTKEKLSITLIFISTMIPLDSCLDCDN